MPVCQCLVFSITEAGAEHLHNALNSYKQCLWRDRLVSHSGLFSDLVIWHAGAVSLPPTDIIFAQPAPLNDVIFVCIGNSQPFPLQTLVMS
jgi:hypothetical protein